METEFEFEEVIMDDLLFDFVANEWIIGKDHLPLMLTNEEALDFGGCTVDEVWSGIESSIECSNNTFVI